MLEEIFQNQDLGAGFLRDTSGPRAPALIPKSLYSPRALAYIYVVFAFPSADE